MSDLVRMHQVYKKYEMGENELLVLKGIDFVLKEGEKICVVGASGSGKSTFLHILGGLDEASAGEVWFRGRVWRDLNEDEKSEIRNREIGFIFQLHHVVKEFSVLENVMLPLRIRGWSHRQSRKVAEYYLSKVGLSHRLSHYPSQLSGGELQRVSIARALVIEPKLLLADEPTGSLDSKTSGAIQDLLLSLHEQFGMGLVVVTHDVSFSQKFPKILRISDGQWV
ncbi:MAG: ABC transporter ATP-binding protein [Bdellovibrionaceae bacterium]|nr:ABC transporter ATP-binding protein [Pseudobdellovibrionaceae bacterium]MDW8189677.1 ABC transporter ATP-binding protein [Pseudobdellovibrionaceae bacterium]